MKKKMIVLCGSNKGNNGSVPTVTDIFYNSLKEEFNIYKFDYVRNKNLNPSKINFENLISFLLEYISFLRIMFKFPAIVHYPLTSFWGFEKSLMFLFTAKIFGAKTIAHLHSGAFFEFWDNLNPFRKYFGTFVLNRTDKIVVLSDYWKEGLIERLGLSDSQFEVVSNPIEEIFNGSIEKRINGEIKVLSVGVMLKNKGILEILKVAKELREDKRVKFFIMGDEKEQGIKKICEKFIKKEKLENIFLLGNKRGEEKKKIFNEAHILYHPSYYENFPLTIIEAAASNLAIVATPKGAIKDYFKDGVSIKLIKEKDVENQTKVLKDLFSSKNQIIQLGQRARITYDEKLANKFPISKMRKIYNELLNS